MNGYIIDPMVFYWINTLSEVKVVFIVITVIIGCALILVAPFVWDYTYGEEDEKKFWKYVKIGVVIFVVGLVGSVFLPSKTTMIEMLVAKYATYENANLTVEGIKSLIDYIVNAMQR